MLLFGLVVVFIWVLSDAPTACLVLDFYVVGVGGLVLDLIG